MVNVSPLPDAGPMQVRVAITVEGVLLIVREAWDHHVLGVVRNFLLAHDTDPVSGTSASMEFFDDLLDEGASWICGETTIV